MRRLRHCGKNDAGFSLAETIVGSFVALLVMGSAGAMFVSAIKSNRTSVARLDTVNQGRVAVESMGRSLRTAVLPSQLDDAASVNDTAFLVGEANSVSFFANINNLGNTIGPSKVSYAINAAGSLIQTVQKPLPDPVNHDFKYCDATLASCAKTVLDLADGVQSTRPLFVYYDQNGTVIPYSTTCPDGNPCLSGLDLGNVDAVDISVVLKQPSATTIGATTYLLRVSLPNHDSIIRDNGGT